MVGSYIAGVSAKPSAEALTCLKGVKLCQIMASQISLID